MTTHFSRITCAACLSLALAASACRHPREPGPAVTRKEIEDKQGEPIDKQIQSKSAGVVVTQTADGGIAVNIRGSSSNLASNEPLYVIDDVPVTPDRRAEEPRGHRHLRLPRRERRHRHQDETARETSLTSQVGTTSA
jgi:TonB-dependent receptor-like protein